MAKSKVAMMKTAQGYVSKQSERPMCSNCANRVFDTEECKVWNEVKTFEKNQRCGVGGFAIKMMAVCKLHKFKK